MGHKPPATSEEYRQQEKSQQAALTGVLLCSVLKKLQRVLFLYFKKILSMNLPEPTS